MNKFCHMVKKGACPFQSFFVKCVICTLQFRFFLHVLFSTGLMADQSGNYINSFYMTGGVLMFAFVIPFGVTFTKLRGSRVSPIVSEMRDLEARNTEPSPKANPSDSKDFPVS